MCESEVETTGTIKNKGYPSGSDLSVERVIPADSGSDNINLNPTE